MPSECFKLKFKSTNAHWFFKAHPCLFALMRDMFSVGKAHRKCADLVDKHIFFFV